jgi:hypothetical protein
MKKGAIVLGILFLSLAILPLVLAEENQTAVDDAYKCLKDKIDEKTCDKLGIEEKIFSLLATRDCKSELINSSKNKECWPSPTCDTEITAKAIFALEELNSNTNDYVNWLLSQNTTTTSIDWYLQIEAEGVSQCTISSGGLSHTINIGEDKKIDSGAGNCLILTDDAYWLKISSGCYDNDFEVSCNNKFITSLLFKEKTSSTINILSETSSASADGTTFEKVESYCFKNKVGCEYESTLWATMVLSYLGQDVSPYLPYIITMADQNEKYLPEGFLFYFMNDEDYRNDLVSKQKIKGYWEESGDKFYDTPLAMLLLQNEDLGEKQTTKDWLLENQGSDGCWNLGNIMDTAFILYSTWPEYSSAYLYSQLDGDDVYDCKDTGFCLSPMGCSEVGGIEIDLYSSSCTGSQICCDKEQLAQTCSEKGGEICSSNENCINGVEDYEADDVGYGEICCVDGTCQSIDVDGGVVGEDEDTECSDYDGACRSSCFSSEEESNYGCTSGDVCCSELTSPSGTTTGNNWWIWVLIILIVLLAVAIIFKDKTKEIFARLKDKFSKGKPKVPRSGGPLMQRQPQRMPPRKIIPPAQRRQPIRRTPPKPSKDLDDVLKKLKDMGK